MHMSINIRLTSFRQLVACGAQPRDTGFDKPPITHPQAAIQPQQRSPAPQRQQQQQSPGRAQPRFTSGRNRGWQQEASTARQDRPLPELSAEVAGQPFLIVVEGINDLRAVRRAVPTADVYVLGSSSAVNKPKVLKELQAATPHYPRGLLLFLDPDVAGRQGRQLLEASLPGCLHAFVPSPLATADRATKYHDIGNVGVEHASPAAIRAALAAPRASNPQRQEFTRDHLLRCGLVAELHARGGNVTARRKLVGAYLGLGECDGKQLMRQLNLYGFTKQEVSQALAWAEPRLAPPGPTVPPQQSKLVL